MSKANGTLASKKETSTLVRAIFEPGMLLQHEDLEQLNAYTRDLSRLLFRSFFGCGVVCGLVVEPYKDPCGKWYVGVGSGLALDCNGDPIYVPKDQQLPIDEKCEQNIDGPLWVLLCGSVKCCGPRTSICSPDDEDPKSVCTRERDCFEIRIVNTEPKCACGWANAGKDEKKPYEQEDTYCNCVNPDLPCYIAHYHGNCKCVDEDCHCCGCDCVLLARLEKSNGTWAPDHRVRRFIRPVLMRDPRIEEERAQQAKKTAQAQQRNAQQAKMTRELEESAQRQRVLTDQVEQLKAQLDSMPKPEPKEQEKSDDQRRPTQSKATKKRRDEPTRSGLPNKEMGVSENH